MTKKIYYLCITLYSKEYSCSNRENRKLADLRCYFNKLSNLIFMKWTKEYTRSLVGGVLFLIIAWLFLPIVAYIIISAIIGSAGRPLVKSLGKIKIRKKSININIRASIVLLFFIAVISTLIAVLSPSIVNQMRTVREINIDEVSLQLDNKLNPMKHVLRERQMVEVNQDFRDNIEENVMKFVEGLNFKEIFANVIGLTGSVFMSVFAILFMSFFFLKDSDLFLAIVLIFVSERNQKSVTNILLKVRKMLERYFFGLFIEVSSMMVLLSTGGLIIGLENAILIGFIGGLLNIIPYIGPLIGASIGAILVLITNIGLGVNIALLMSGQILIVFAVANMIDNFILQPLIYSNSVQMHPLAIFIFIYAGGMLGGPLGMILAIPVITVLRIIVGEFFGDDPLIKKLTHDNESL